jgi:hypothetical protein
MSPPPPDDRATLDQFLCPQCAAEVQEQWVACPGCGLRLKPHTDLLPRIALWGGIFLSFVWVLTLMLRHEPAQAGWFALLAGLPLCYIFGKAVVFRLRGKPLTWQQLGWTSVRTVVVSFGLMVVLPIVIGVALVLLLLAVCTVAMGTGQL